MMTEKTRVEKRRDDLIEAISLQSQIDQRTAESIVNQVKYLDNILSSSLGVENIAMVVAR